MKRITAIGVSLVMLPWLTLGPGCQLGSGAQGGIRTGDKALSVRGDLESRSETGDVTVLANGAPSTTTTGGLSVGGGTDSMALWLAVLGLIILNVLNPIIGGHFYKDYLRPKRLKAENGHA